MDTEMFRPLLFPALLLLISAFITIRVMHYKRNRENFDNEFKEFRLVFTDFIPSLWNNGAALNRILIDNFPAHEAGVARFIHNIKGKRRRRLYSKWNEYKEYYNKASSLGVFVDVVAETPPGVDIQNATELDIEVFDYMQRKHIHSILNDLIDIANKPIWF